MTQLTLRGVSRIHLDYTIIDSHCVQNTFHIMKQKAYLSALIKVPFILNIVDAFKKKKKLIAYLLLKP